MKTLVSYIVLLVAVTYSMFAAEAYRWKPTNGPYGGYIRNMVYDEATKDIYANSAHLYQLDKSTDNWKIRNLDFDSTINYRLFIAGDMYFVNAWQGDDAIYELGLYRSSDRGLSWNIIEQQSIGEAHDILYIDSINIFAALGYRGVFKSIDKGKAWSKCENGIDSMTKIRGDFDKLEKFVKDGKTYIFLGIYNFGFYRSSNSGDFWEKKTDGLPKGNVVNFTISKDNNLYLAIMDSGIYRSTDLGDTWEKFSKGLENLGYFDVSAMTSDKYGNVYASTYYYGLFCLRSGSDKWEFINNGLINNDVWDILYIPDTDELFASTTAGIYKSTNLGNNWFFYNKGINIPTAINCIAFTKNGGFLAGSEDNGIYFSSDSGNSWSVSNSGLENNNIRTLKVNKKGEVFAYTNEENIYMSTSNGADWKKVYSRNGDWYPYISQPIAINSRDEIFAIVADSTIIFSNDDGNSWKNLFTTKRYIDFIFVDRNDNLFICHDSSIFKSSDNGLTWPEVNKHNQWLSINVFYEANNNTIFAGTNRDYILRSTDGGNTWTHLINNLPKNGEFTCFASTANSDKIYSGTNYDGFFVSTDNGNIWNNFDFQTVKYRNGNEIQISMEPDVFRGLVADKNDNVYAATYEGVYKMETYDKIIETKAVTIEINIYPNPASDELFIESEYLDGMEIKISDLLGKTVWTGIAAGQRMIIDTRYLWKGAYNIQIGFQNHFFVKI